MWKKFTISYQKCKITIFVNLLSDYYETFNYIIERLRNNLVPGTRYLRNILA